MKPQTELCECGHAKHRHRRGPADHAYLADCVRCDCEAYVEDPFAAFTEFFDGTTYVAEG